MASLLEMREIDADPVTADIYTDIRASSALPQVNLIYRHLATLPGALPAIWNAIRPWMRSAAADEAIAPLLTASFGVDAMRTAELARVDAVAVLNLLSVYGRGNALNLIALSGVRRRLENPALPPGSAPKERGAVPHIPRIPSLPRLDALPLGTRTLVAGLAALHDAAQRGVTPSLYLHLAHWPGLLPSVERRIESYVRQGGLASDRASIVAATAAFGIEGAPDTLRPLPPSVRDQALSAIVLFTTSVIPDLVAVGRLLTGAVSRGVTPDLPSAALATAREAP